MFTPKIFASALVAGALSLPALAVVEPPPDAPLVQRGDVVVTVEDFKAALNKLPEAERGNYRGDIGRITQTVSSVYVNRMLAREAEAAGIDKEPEVQKRLQLLRENLLASIRMERFEKTIKAPDYEARAKELYAADPKVYEKPEKVKFRHILVSFQGRTREEALRRVEEARAKLLANESFWRVAHDYSNDPTFRGNDGTIGPVPYSMLASEIAKTAKQAPLNEVSAPIESGAGYHLIVVLGRSPGSTVPFSAAKKSLIEAEQEKYRKAQMDKKIADLVDSKDVTMFTDNIAGLKTELDRDALDKLLQEKAKQKAAQSAADAAK